MHNSFILAPNFELSKTVSADVTVEAEYGKNVATGTVYTAAHHQSSGPFQGSHLGGENPAPCNNTGIPVMQNATVLVSHVDLDTVGGCLRTEERFIGLFGSSNDGFWNLAEFVDTNGPHKLDESGATTEDIDKLYAWWQYQEETVGRFSRSENTNVTAVLEEAGVMIQKLLNNNEALINKGKAWRKMMENLNPDTFVQLSGKVAIRIANRFVNHMYETPTGEQVDAIVCLYPAQGNITVSTRENWSDKGVNVCEIVQHLWGDEAGGHPFISGSPRGQRMSIEDVLSVVALLNMQLN